MRLRSICTFAGSLLATVLLSLAPAFAIEPAGSPPNGPTTGAPLTLQAAMAEYHRKLEKYNIAHQKYNDDANAYWRSIAERRRLRIAKRRGKDAMLIDD